MPAAYVQEIGKNTKNAAGSTLVITAAANAGAGNMLVIRGIGGGGVAVSTVTDSRGNTWTIDKSHASSPKVFIASTLQNAGAIQSGDTITVTYASSVTPAAAICDEFSGIASSSRVDQTQTATAATTNRDAGTTGTLSQADELVVAAFGSGTQETAAWTHGSGYSDFTTPFLNSTTTIIMVEGEYKIVAATTAVHPTATGITSPSGTNGLVVTYKAAGGTTQVISPTIAGAGSLSASVTPYQRITVAIGGTSSLSSTVVPYHRITPSISGSSSLSATVTPYQRITIAVGGTSSLSASVTPYQRIAATLAGTSSLSSTVTPYQRITVAIAGTSSLSATTTPYQRLTISLAGTSTLAATVTPFQPITATIAGSSSLSTTVVPYQQIVVTIAGSGSLSADLQQYQAITVDLAGTSTLTSSLSFKRAINVDIAGFGTLAVQIAGGQPVTPTSPFFGTQAPRRRRPFIRLRQFTIDIAGTSTLQVNLDSIYGTGTSVPPGHRLPFAGEAYFDEEEMAVLREFELI